MDVLPVIGGALAVLGALFLLLAAIGVVRMPDVYNRMQAGTKATTLGSMLFLLGVGLARPEWFGRIVLLILFVVFTNPISSHALARAAHAAGIPASDKTVGDALADDSDDEQVDPAAADPPRGIEPQLPRTPGNQEETT
jgi:multicomponent Na+:H+ antiporter subunit G